MPFWLTLFLFVGVTIAQELLRPRAKFGVPQPSSLGDFQVPTAQEGRAIPVVYGTCNVKGANVVWYGDLVVQAITKKVKTGLFSSDRVTTGYRYFLGAQLALCHGEVDELEAVRFDDRDMPVGGINIRSHNDGVVFGTIPGSLTTAHIAHAFYDDLTELAQAVQSAVRAAGGTNWRTVYGFEVVAGVTDEFVYTVQLDDNSFTADQTVTIPAAKYDGIGYATALTTAIAAVEALASGGPRIRLTVMFDGSRMRISGVVLRSGWKGFQVRGSGVNYNSTTLPLIGAKLGYDVTTALPGIYVPPGTVGEKRFMFAAPTLSDKLGNESAAFTAADALGIDTTASTAQTMRPDHDWTTPWGVIGYSGADKMSTALSDGSLTTFGIIGTEAGLVSGGLCAPVGFSVRLAPADDPGTDTPWTVSFTGYRGGTGTGGQVDIDVKVYAGENPDGAGTGPSTLIATFTHTLTKDAWVVFSDNLDSTQRTNFRNAGGFTIGARVDFVASYSGLPSGDCNNVSARIAEAVINLPRAPYKVIRHHRAARSVEVFGVQYTESADKVIVDINLPTLFGGEEREGGIVGRIDFYKGTLTQTANDYLQTALGVLLPAYRGISYAVLRRLYVGTTPYIRNIGFILRRCPNQLGLTDGRHNINGDANPAAMLYDILTNNRWGLGISSALIETASFVAAGNVLAAEEFGLSMMLDQGAGARDVMAEIQRHVDAVIYTDPATGLIKLRLIRADYAPGDPIRLDVYNLTSCRMSRPAWDDTSNVAKVSYVNRAENYSERVVQAMDLANLQVRGGDIAEEQFAFRGISNADLAQRTAARVLKTISYPIAVLEMECNRAAWYLRPGDVVRVTWAPLGISDMACRVTRIATGSLLNGTIRIDAVEDIFGISATGYTAPGSTSWVDPITEPDGLAAAALLELPYALVVGPSRLVMTLGAQSSQVQTGYEVWSDAAGGTRYAKTEEVRDLTPSGTLAVEMGFTDNSLRVTAGAGVALLSSITDGELAGGKHVALIDEELIAWQFVSLNTDGTYTLGGVVRGVADTTPRLHAYGARVWFVTEGNGFTSASPYISDVTVTAKLLAFTALGVQELDDVAAVALTTNSRALRPYVPGGVKVSGFSYPDLIGTSDITVSWKHRNRLAEWSWANAGETTTPEAGTTYNLRFYDNADTLVRTYTGLTDPIKTWSTEVADSGQRNERVRIELEAVVGGVVSFQVFNFTVWRNMAQQQSMSREVAVTAAGRRRRDWKRRAWQRDGEDDYIP